MTDLSLDTLCSAEGNAKGNLWLLEIGSGEYSCFLDEDFHQSPKISLSLPLPTQCKGCMRDRIKVVNKVCFEDCLDSNSGSISHSCSVLVQRTADL